jgi:hypothetical protein
MIIELRFDSRATPVQRFDDSVHALDKIKALALRPTAAR